MQCGCDKIKKRHVKGEVWEVELQAQEGVFRKYVALRNDSLLKSPSLSIRLSHNVDLNSSQWAGLSSGLWRMGTIRSTKKRVDLSNKIN